MSIVSDKNMDKSIDSLSLFFLHKFFFLDTEKLS